MLYVISVAYPMILVNMHYIVRLPFVSKVRLNYPGSHLFYRAITSRGFSIYKEDDLGCCE